MGEGGLAILTTYKSTGMILQVVREFPDPERCNKLPGGDCYHPTCVGGWVRSKLCRTVFKDWPTWLGLSTPPEN